MAAGDGAGRRANETGRFCSACSSVGHVQGARANRSQPTHPVVGCSGHLPATSPSRKEALTLSRYMYTLSWRGPSRLLLLLAAAALSTCTFVHTVSSPAGSFLACVVWGLSGPSPTDGLDASGWMHSATITLHWTIHPCPSTTIPYLIHLSPGRTILTWYRRYYYPSNAQPTQSSQLIRYCSSLLTL